jgi:aspartate/methionine/tyrosine aminotransferase
LVSPPIVPLARRMDHIAPFHVMELLAKGRAHEARGRSIVHMEIGEPDFPAAEPIVRATAQALQEGRTHYTPAVGLPVLREAIAQWYAERCAVEVDPQRVVVTPGASGALQLIFGVLVDPADRVLMTDPGYPCNRHFVRLFEGKPVGIPVDATSGYQLTPELVEQTWTPQTRAVLVGSPANPTGTLIAPDALERIYQWVTERGGRLIVDEIYHGLVYGHTVRSALAGRSDLFVVNSFSKYFGMTGWRVGWIVAPLGYVRELDKLAQNIFISPATLSQHAALAALRPDTVVELEHRRRLFRERRDYLVPALRELGLHVAVEPRGAFYVYANCSSLSDNSFRLAEDLLELAGVAVTPGIDFGVHRAHQHLRFAYTTSLPNLQEGVGRIRRFLDARCFVDRGG